MKTKRKTRSRVKQADVNQEQYEKVQLMLGIPMKERLLPDSFWLPPNRPTNNIRKHTSSNELFETRTGLITITSPPDTNLLFSLFKILEQSKQHKIAGNAANTSTVTPKRTKPKKPAKIMPSIITVTDKSAELAVDDDDLLAEQQQQQHHTCPQKQLQILDDPYLSLKQGHSMLNKKFLKSNESYSDLLSDLVVNL